MSWFTLSIISIFFLAGGELIQQHLLNTKNAFNEKASVAIMFLAQSLFTISLLFLFGVSNQVFTIFQYSVFPKVLLVTLLSSVSMILYFKSFKVKNISISTIFISFSAVVSAILGIIFFSESTSVLKFLGIALVLIAIGIANYKNAVLEKNHLYGLAAGLIFGILYTLDKNILFDVHPLVYILWSFFMVSFWSFAFGFKHIYISIKNRTLGEYLPIIIAAVGYFSYNFLTFTAYRFGGEVGRIDAINNSEIFLLILFEYFVLKQIQGTRRKLISAGLAISGVLILGFAQ